MLPVTSTLDSKVRKFKSILGKQPSGQNKSEDNFSGCYSSDLFEKDSVNDLGHTPQTPFSLPTGIKTMQATTHGSTSSVSRSKDGPDRSCHRCMGL